MESDKITKKIKDLEIEAVGLFNQNKEAEILLAYDGEDRVISSVEALEELEAENQLPIFKVQTGIPKLDEIVGDFREGQVVVLSAPTGQGKTSFAQTLTYAFGEKNINCLWFSYEVGIQEFMEKMPNAPVFYLPRRIKQNSLKWLENKSKEALVKFDAKVIFIDHLHYLLEMSKMAEAKSISLLVGMMMRDLKRMAIENKAIIFLISHMRKVQYQERMPDMDDLRDSSFVGQEADIVLFIHRLKEKDEDGREVSTNNALLKVAKNRRTGNLGYVKLMFINGRFQEISEIVCEPI